MDDDAVERGRIRRKFRISRRSRGGGGGGGGGWGAARAISTKTMEQK